MAEFTELGFEVTEGENTQIFQETEAAERENVVNVPFLQETEVTEQEPVLATEETEVTERENVLISTFIKWPFSDDFKIVEMQENGQIGKLKCRVCSRNIEQIKAEAKRRKIKGVVVKGILNYAQGIEYVHKGNIVRHIRPGGLHDWAKQSFPLNFDDSVSEIDLSGGYSCTYEPQVKMLPQKVYMNYVHPSSLLRQLSDLWRMDQLCDAVITVDKVIVAKAHKLMMFAVSPRLKAESMSSTQSPILDVCLPSGVSHNSVRAFLQYLYEGFLTLNKDVAKDLVVISKYLQINCLLTCCSEFLKECGSDDDNQVILADVVSQKFLSDYQHVRSTPFQDKTPQMKRPMATEGRNTASKRKKIIVQNRPKSIESQDSDLFVMSADHGESRTSAGTLQNSEAHVDINDRLSSSDVSSDKQSISQTQNESETVIDDDVEENEEMQAEEGMTRFYVEDVQSGRNVYANSDWSTNNDNNSEQASSEPVNVKFEVQSSCQYEKSKAIPSETDAQFGDHVLPHSKISSSGYNTECKMEALGCVPLDDADVSTASGYGAVDSSLSRSNTRTSSTPSTSTVSPDNGDSHDQQSSLNSHGTTSRKRPRCKRVLTTPSGKHFKCQHCDQSFSKRNSYNRHNKKHSGTLKKCEFCSKTFYDNYDLRHHKDTAHFGKPIKCKSCGKRYKTMSGYRKHLVTHTGTYKYKCEVCGKGFLYRTCLREHVDAHHCISVAKCNECNAQFKSHRSFAFHKTVCGKIKEYECSICCKMFKSEKYLKEHMHIHNSPSVYQCDVCGKRYSHRGSLKNHQTTKHLS